MAPRLFRVIVQVTDIESAARFYETALGVPGVHRSQALAELLQGRTCIAVTGTSTTSPATENRRLPVGLMPRSWARRSVPG